jgi:prepilin-type N-terminal cleavage/methylation domain-containing protein/prepilin-type processing-associated H-X9-DG protein
MKKQMRGFTLIELLVVIAIIALLLSIMVPALRIAKEYAAAAVCLTNQKNLCLAWVMYYEENDALLVGGSTYYSGTKPTPYRWVEPPLRSDKDNPEFVPMASVAEFSMQTRVNGIRAGKLFPYTQDPSLYHCPADRTFVKNNEPLALYRSYAITGLMNGEDFVSRQSGIYSPIKEYRSVGGKTLYVVTKFTEIKSPGNKYVFVEEDVSVKGQNYNLGGFVLMNSGPISWWDWPAYYHNDSSTLGFADGHAERIRWHDPDTLKLMKDGTADPSPATNEDLIFLIRGYIPKP